MLLMRKHPEAVYCKVLSITKLNVISNHIQRYNLLVKVQPLPSLSIHYLVSSGRMMGPLGNCDGKKVLWLSRSRITGWWTFINHQPGHYQVQSLTGPGWWNIDHDEGDHDPVPWSHLDPHVSSEQVTWICDGHETRSGQKVTSGGCWRGREASSLVQLCSSMEVRNV